MKKWIDSLKKKAMAGISLSHSKLMALLRYLRINDENDNLSLTNIAMIVMLWKIGTTDAASITDLTALCVAILGYQAKRVIEKKKD